jgi:TIR domain/SIR2-like domain
MPQSYDTFISYRSADQEAVSPVVSALKDQGIVVWYDDDQIEPGSAVIERIEEGLGSSKSVVLFVGRTGFGGWQDLEYGGALERAVYEGLRLIPVLLPGVSEKDLPLTMKRLKRIEFDSYPTVERSKVIDRLIWGITGRRPASASALAPLEPENRAQLDEVEEALATLTALLRSGNITLFVGRSVGADPLLPSAYRMTRRLLAELQLLEAESTAHVLPHLDMVASLFADRRGEALLDLRLTEFLTTSGSTVSDLCRQVAEFVRRLVARSAALPGGLPQMIVTTSLDLMLERALLSAGIPFTRIVQHRSGRSIDINEYRGVALRAPDRLAVQPATGAPFEVALNNLPAVDRFIATHGRRRVEWRDSTGGVGGNNPLQSLSLEGLVEPILYKYHGSQDLRSCAVSREQYLEFACSATAAIPTQITKILANTPLLFLGYSLLDPDLRFTYYTLLRQSLELHPDPIYAVRSTPLADEEDIFRRMEQRIGPALCDLALQKMKIKVLDHDGEAFLRALCQSLPEAGD